MRDEPSSRRTSPLTWLMCALVAGFLMQMVCFRMLHLEDDVERIFAVTIPALKAGHAWVLLTAGLLHSPLNLLHIVGVLFALYFLGRELLPMLGGRRFIGLCVFAQVVGGLAWAAVNWRHLAEGGSLYGAMPMVDALIVVYACFFPNREMSLLLFFLLPVRLKPKYIAVGVFLFDLFGFLFYELTGAVSPFGLGFAHSAHLAGMAAGWLYYRFVHDAEWNFFSQRSEVELPQWLRRSAPRAAVAVGAPRAGPGSREEFRAEIDRILDKINSDGFGSLTAEEKRRLDEARDLLSRR